MTFLILAGGSGKRLFPLSREKYPKQFLSLTGEHTLLEETLLRTDGKPCLVIGSRLSCHLLQKAVDDVNAHERCDVIGEPLPRNTAPAILLGLSRLPDSAVVTVMPSDHYIQDRAAFRKSLRSAEELARDGYITTLGITPDRPETGYGYIRKGAPLNKGFQVSSFTEKPDLPTARNYLSSGETFWNSGMFVFEKKVLIQEVKSLHPGLYRFYCEISQAGPGEWEKIYEQAPDISIDYAVMEKTKRAAVVSGDFGWTDIGSWEALKRLLEPGEDNAVLSTELYAEGSRDNLVITDHKSVGLIGVSGTAVVDTGDFLFVGDLSRSQEVRALAARVREKEPGKAEAHRDEVRPWGSFASLREEKGFKVKKITVSPGEQLSLQYHHHRDEDWIIVRGEGMMTLGDREFKVVPGDHVHIPKEEVHTIEGITETVFIEVQRGDDLGEDDIVRLKDRYGRS